MKFSRRLQQALRSKDIGQKKWRSVLNAAVHVRFSGEINDGIEPLAKNVSYGRRVANVPSNKGVAGVRGDVRKTLRISRVGQLIEIDDFDAAIRAQ
jgi:hypothetical protein